MNLRFRLLLLMGLLGLSARGDEGNTLGWVENLHLTASGTASWVNNQSRTSYEPTRKDTTTYEFRLGGTQSQQLAPNLLLVASADINSQWVQKYDLADTFIAAGRVSLQRKFGLGPLAPILQFNVGTSYKSARFGGDRGWTTEGGIQLAQRVLTNLRLAAGAQWIEHNAQSAVFDLNQHSLSFDAMWDINDHWSLSGNVSRLGGDIVANAAWPIWLQAITGGLGSTVQSYYTSRPWMVTNIYGPNWVSYNVEADVDLWSVSLAYAASDRTSIELRHSGAYVVNKIGIAYPTDSWSLGLNHRF